MQKATIINRTIEVKDKIDPEKLRQDMSLIAGKAAGICYAPDNYLDEGIQNEEAALKRSKGTAKSGHYSTYEHGYVSFLIETNKMMAMILNSLGFYATSEKSARYTKMVPQSDIELEMYEKWTTKIENLIREHEPDRPETEVHKLAIENARYMISVFTPTIMEYTIPYNRAVLLCQWLWSGDLINERLDQTVSSFTKRVIEESIELADSIAQQIGITRDDVLLEDHKDVGLSRTFVYVNEWDDFERTAFIGDNYIVQYEGSLAQLAQAQRHRTIDYTMLLLLDNNDHPEHFYVPNIVNLCNLTEEWLSDIKKVVEAGTIPQGTMVLIIERGRIEDFILKAKERLCSRAQFEICMQTMFTLEKLYYNEEYISSYNKKLISKFVNEENGVVRPRCKCDGYTCKEPCRYGVRGLERII